MSFINQYKNLALRIMSNLGVTEEMFQNSKTNPKVLKEEEESAKVAIRLADYYASNTWVGENKLVNRMWQENEKQLSKLAKTISDCEVTK